MPLFNIDEKIQASTGKQEHWKLFRRFEGSDLHQAMVLKIANHLQKEMLYSSWLGSEILKQLEKEYPNLFEPYQSESGRQVISGLFGMTLWNVLADHGDSWYFHQPKIDSLDELTGTYYFKNKRT